MVWETSGFHIFNDFCSARYLGKKLNLQYFDNETNLLADIFLLLFVFLQFRANVSFDLIFYEKSY